MNSDEINNLKKAIQETLIDLLQSLDSAKLQIVIHRALSRFDPSLWPFSIDIPPNIMFMSDPKYRTDWKLFAITVDMIQKRDVFEKL